MSILIKGMEMPKSCRECRFCNGQADTDYGVCAWCDVDGKARDAYTMQDCPLVPVPEHGRLIDVDYADEYAYDELEVANNYLTGWEAARAMQKIYQNAPTIIPAEGGE